MTSLIKNNRVYLKFTDEEFYKFKKLWNSLQTELKIGPKRKSEIFAEAFFQYAENLLKSKDIYTQTNQHSLNEKELRIEKLNKIIGFIKAKPKPFKQVFNYFFNVFGLEFGTYRTRFNWLKHLFETNEFVILDLRHHLGDFYVLEKGSYFHAQFKNHCFEFPYNTLNYQPTSEVAAKKKIYQYLNSKSNILNSEYLDKAEKFVVIAFKSYLEGDEKPMNTDMVISEVMRLRSEWKHKEALELLQKEKENKKMLQDEGLELLNQLVEVEK